MKKKFSIKKNYQFKYIFNKGKSAQGKIVKIIYTKNNKKNNRLGLCVNKNIKTVPLKNRAKRLMKEAFRNISLKQGYDIVMIWKPEYIENEYVDVYKDVENIFKKLDILDEETIN